jgi:hypothetical protein
MPDEALVLTVNPHDSRSNELLGFIRACGASVFVSKIRGFGRPELRIGANEFVRGTTEIRKAIQQAKLDR